MSETLWRKSMELWKKDTGLIPEEQKILDEWVSNLVKDKDKIVLENKKLDRRKKNFHGISVVMPVFNRAHLLDITLPTLYKQKFSAELEIVIVDDRSTDNIYDIVNKHNKECGIIKHIRINIGHVPKLNPNYIHSISGPKNSDRINANYAINVGIKRSKYDIILLTSAEVYHLKDTLQMFYNKHEETNFDWYHISSYGAGEVHGDTTHGRELLKKASEDFLNQISINESNINLEWFKKWNFMLRYFHNPHCVSFTRPPFCLIHGFDEDDYGWGWGDLEFNHRMQNIGVVFINIPDPLDKKDVMWIHLYHNILDLPDGGVYNRLISIEKRLQYSPKDFFTVKGNRRNLEGWGEKYTLHEFAKEFYKISNEDYNFWLTRSYDQLNKIYNEAWKKYDNHIDFYKNSIEYSLGTTFKQYSGGVNPHYSARKSECLIPSIKGNTVLDYACGLGYMSIGYYHNDAKLTLMDIDSPMSRMLMKYYTYCLGFDDIEFIAINDETILSNIDRKWDIVICFNALPHMKKAKEVLELLHLRTNKYLIVNDGFQSDISLHLSKIEINQMNLPGFEFIGNNTYRKIE